MKAGPMRFQEVIRDIQDLPRKLVIYRPEGAVAVSQSTDVVLVPAGGEAPGGWTYVLELWVAREVLEVWSAWRGGRVPSLAEACAAVVYYVENDAYLPETV